MKPSKFVLNNFIDKSKLNTYLGTITKNKLNELDSRFIDREELKEKIKYIIKPYMEKDRLTDAEEILEKILKLLKEVK